MYVTAAIIFNVVAQVVDGMISAQHKVLILGSGMCTPALVHYMLTHNFYVVLANR
jgi:hypothetical protein